MGIMFFLIFYAIALTTIATVGAAVLGTATYFFTKSSARRKRAVLISALFPYACVAFAGAWFIAYAVINEAAFHRDPGLGDTWETPLPNGYALLMIDTTDQGTVYNPKTQGGYGIVSSRGDTEFGVRDLQVCHNLIFGARDSGYFGRIGQDSKVVDTYFELDTTSNHTTEYKNLDELRQRAATRGVMLNLKPFESVFGEYRTTWFDYFAAAVLVLVPLAGFVVLFRWVFAIRRSEWM